jgi:hypothetical protein
MTPTTVVIRHPYGLPMGTVRGFISVLICSFFWIFLLLPESGDPTKQTAPLGHFFLLTMVFLAFASHPVPTDTSHTEFLPWLMRVLFVGGSLAVVGFTLYSSPHRLSTRLTPDPNEIGQWPVLLATLSGGFAVGLLLRKILGSGSDLFQTIRAWAGVIGILLLIVETVFQFLVRPHLNDPFPQEGLKIWQGVLVSFVAAYFGSRA